MKTVIAGLVLTDDLMDEQFKAECDEFALKAMDAYVRREMRMILDTTDEVEVADAASLILDHYTLPKFQGKNI